LAECFAAAAAPAVAAAAIGPSSSVTPPRPRPPPPDSAPGSVITGRNRRVRVARTVLSSSPQLSSGGEFGGDSEGGDSDSNRRFGSSSSPFTFQCSRPLPTSSAR
jgi:hypothetical protein